MKFTFHDEISLEFSMKNYNEKTGNLHKNGYQKFALITIPSLSFSGLGIRKVKKIVV